MGTDQVEAQAEFRTISMAQPYGSHRFSVWSPKLQRTVTLYSEADVDAWTILELDPSVLRMVERPHRIKLDKRSLVFNFYIEYSNRKSFLVVVDDDDFDSIKASIDSHIGFQSFIEDRNIAVEYWQKSFLKEKSVYTENGKTVLHSLSANARFLTRDLKSRTRDVISCSQSVSLRAVKESLSDEDPVLVAASIFSLLSSGELACSSIEINRLTDATEFKLAGT